MDKKRILQEFAKRIYNFAKVGREFRLIEEGTKTILVKRENEAEELLEQMRRQGYSKSAMRRAQQYCIQVYDRDFEKLYSVGMVREVSADIEDFFELVKESQYTEDMGLDLGVESGMAVVL